MNNETDLSRVTRVFVILAACGLILSVLASLFINLLADPANPESVQNVHAALRAFNLLALVLLTLGLFGIARAYRSRLWLVCFSLFTLRALMGIVEIITLLGVRPESKGMQLALLVFYSISVVAAWAALGVTLIIRRSDGEAGLGIATGVSMLAGISLWVVYFLALLGVLSFSSFVLWITELAGALTLTTSLLLPCFLFCLLMRPGRPAAEVRGRLFFYMGAAGSILIVTGLLLIWHQAVGRQVFADRIIYTFAVMAGLGFLGAGMGYLGQTLASRSPHGLVAATVVWLQLVFFATAMIESTSLVLIWITGLLALAAQVAGGISFLHSRKMAAPMVAVATGVVLLACALVSLALLAFLGETGIDLPWRVRQVLFAIVQTGMLAAFTLAAVHHLQVAASAPRS